MPAADDPSSPSVSLDAPLSRVVGSAKAAGPLEDGLGLFSVRDLLNHLPRRYQKRGELTAMRELVIGELATVQARVGKVEVKGPPPYARRGGGGRRPPGRVEVTVTDGSTALRLTFFNQIWWSKKLAAGMTVLASGKVDTFNGKLQMVNPEVQIPGGDELDDFERDLFAGALLPIYPATERVPTWRISRAVRFALSLVDVGPDDDPVPAALRRRRGLSALGEAYEAVHHPDSYADVERGRKRLRYDEAFVLQVELARRRAATERLPATPRLTVEGGLLAAFDAALPYTLTDGQREVGERFAAEIARDVPMHRLLQGDVGSGKTVVALRAALQVVDGGGQAAILAPTEVLATQHARGIRDLLGPLGRAGELDSADIATRVALLTGSQGAAARRQALAEIASGEAGIVVGTHALLEPTVQWKDLGLVVVDEQHRFGVEQRDALRTRGAQSGAAPHVLVMTATPIPRTIAMTIYGDLESSALTELPRGRQPIASHVVPPEKPQWLDAAWRRVRDEVAAGRQAFVVCPQITGDATDDTGDAPPPDDGGRSRGAAVEEVVPHLLANDLAGLRVAALHGKMPADDKDATMSAFARGDIDVLVATTVIEVGIDVPNATVMVILDADRFGVSQLHQLRGRVGRGRHASFCLLQTSAEPGTPARERVEAVAKEPDGFKLSYVDLEQRREGDVLGASQSGRRGSIRLLDVLKHEDLIAEARADAIALIAEDPTLRDHPALGKAVRSMLDPADAAFLEKG
ncbi:MAG TPA: ATP-dependent DNA helicase RecG [Mycobacteriales bacterium]|nr:ATP-dependent DNA helicase RecG [Mycobacteriales bacterium]